MHSIAYHQVAEEYTLKRGDMLAKGEMIYSLFARYTRKKRMIYQVCDLDKKIPVPQNEDFLVETTGLEPVTPCMSSKYSNQLSYASNLLTLQIISQ